MGFMSANGLFWKSVDRYIDKCKVGRSTLMPYIKNIFKRKFLMHICFIFIDNFISPHKCSKYSVPLMEWLLQEHQPCQCQDRKSSFVISGRQQASPSQGSSCLSPLPAPPPPREWKCRNWALQGAGVSQCIDPVTETGVLCCSIGDITDSLGQWRHSEERSQDGCKIRHRWVISCNRQLSSFLFAHHHQSENHNLSMWNCKFVWHVVVSTHTKFPTRGSLSLPFSSLLLTCVHSRYFPTSCLPAPLVSRFALTQPKSSSWPLTYSHNWLLTYSGPLLWKIKMH